MCNNFRVDHRHVKCYRATGTNFFTDQYQINMYSSIVLTVLLALSQTTFAILEPTITNPRILESQIIEATECIVNQLNSGIEICGIPSFDPLSVESAEVDLSGLGVTGLSGVLAVTDLEMTGITHLQYESLSDSITLLPPGYRIRATILWPQITLNTSYVLTDFQYGNEQSWGTGTLSFAANNVRATVDVQISILSGISVSSCSINLSVDDVDYFTVTGLRDDEEYSASISDSVEANPSGILELLNDSINSATCEAVSNLINSSGDDSVVIECLKDRCL